jgi:hypothetical protein
MRTTPTETEHLSQKLTEAGIPFTETERKMEKPMRSAANAQKVAILKDLLDQVDEEEVDKFFLDILVIAEGVGFRFKAPGAVLLRQIDRQFA